MAGQPQNNSVWNQNKHLLLLVLSILGLLSLAALCSLQSFLSVLRVFGGFVRILVFCLALGAIVRVIFSFLLLVTCELLVTGLDLMLILECLGLFQNVFPLRLVIFLLHAQDDLVVSLLSIASFFGLVSVLLIGFWVGFRIMDFPTACTLGMSTSSDIIVVGFAVK